jgi:hypothetical protein
VPDLALDTSRSRVRIQTFAEGFLARLAHDLELICSELSGTASPDAQGAPGGKVAGTANVDAPLRGIAIAGVLGKDGKVDPEGLSPSDQHDAVVKMQHDVFHAGPEGVVRIEARYDGEKASVRLVAPNGKAAEAVVRPQVTQTNGAVHARGTFEVSLKAIGADPVKGPMGAFRVKDRVNVLFDVVFTPRA